MTRKATPETVADLVPDPRNARRHPERNLAVIANSLKEVGAARSIVIDEKGVVLAGNGVCAAAPMAGISKVRIVDAKGDEIIAVRRTGLTKKQKTALALADNRAGELSEWDPDVVRSFEDAGADLSTMWTPGELDKLFGRSEEIKAGNTDPDDTPEERATDIRRGDILALGSHRLLCGDSTDPDSVAIVIGDAKPGLMNTDPPYGIDYVALKRGIPGFKFSNDVKDADISNDDLTDGAALQAFLESMIRAAVPLLSDSPAFYLWHPMLTQGTFFAAAADILIHRQIIWVKPQMVLTRSGQYHWKHELAFYGWIRGKPCPWYGDKSQVSVWEIGESTRGRQHPTQKPVALFLPPIQNHTRFGDAVYEPFAGSGSQFIAAEQAGRRCLGVEIEPKYCQVVIDRWEAFTGQKAQKVGEVCAAESPRRRNSGS